MYRNAFLQFASKFYGYFVFVGSYLQSLVLLYMRITWGHQFFLTGLGKLHNIAATTKFFASLHLLFPEFHAYFIGWVETLGGLFLFIGLASRAVSLPLIITMLVALATAHSPDISEFRFLLEPMKLVKQTPYPFFITAMLVFCFGPGKISVDGWIKRWVEKQPKF